MSFRVNAMSVFDLPRDVGTENLLSWPSKSSSECLADMEKCMAAGGFDKACMHVWDEWGMIYGPWWNPDFNKYSDIKVLDHC
jgi:hypothetical protein